MNNGQNIILADYNDVTVKLTFWIQNAIASSFVENVIVLLL